MFFVAHMVFEAALLRGVLHRGGCGGICQKKMLEKGCKADTRKPCPLGELVHGTEVGEVL